ncbi:Hypothetical predicted protein [Marmota monax]|uniref:Uncharacterized protein n=1 Tax=Marmota monax TaxID=9995 RepID=A0A5E4BN51_MARMO|nr:hypothetical protein GHT09_019787 [Marmota monax]VTJ70411.1 Hypothetical predicted protein [Marmota monax]
MSSLTLSKHRQDGHGHGQQVDRERDARRQQGQPQSLPSVMCSGLEMGQPGGWTLRPHTWTTWPASQIVATVPQPPPVSRPEKLETSAARQQGKSPSTPGHSLPGSWTLPEQLLAWWCQHRSLSWGPAWSH